MKRILLLLCMACIVAETQNELGTSVATQPSSVRYVHVISIDPAMFRESDSVIVVEYGTRRISLTADQVMWLLKDALFRWNAAKGGKRRGK